MLRKTIENEVSYIGTGVYSKRDIVVRLCPAECGNGIRLIRDDCKDDNIIVVNSKSIFEVKHLNTTISNKKHEVLMIEHLMFALWAFGITDIDIHVNCNEIPMLDGSAKYWIRLLNGTNIKNFDKENEYKYVSKEVKYFIDDFGIIARPLDHLRITYTIDFEEKSIGKDTLTFDENCDNYVKEISMARTFCTKKQVLQHLSIKENFTYQNIVVFDDNGFKVDDGKLRYRNEPTRHKILDLIGDLMSTGSFIRGEFICNKSGHAINRKLIELLKF